MMLQSGGFPGLFRWFLIVGALLSGGWETRPAAASSITLYLAQPGTPAAIPNFVDPNAGCDWWGVGGQLFNEAGRPEIGLIVRISGAVDGVAVNQSVVSGSSLVFGTGGYELRLATYLPASATLRMQVFDSGGRALSGIIPLPLYRTCTQNLLVMNLRQRSYSRFAYIPLVAR